MYATVTLNYSENGIKVYKNYQISIKYFSELASIIILS